MKTIILLLLSFSLCFGANLCKIEYGGNQYVVDKDRIVSIEPNTVSKEGCFFSRRQNKEIYIPADSRAIEISQGLKNGNLTPIKDRVNTKIILTLADPINENQKDAKLYVEIFIEAPVAVVTEQLDITK